MKLRTVLIASTLALLSPALAPGKVNAQQPCQYDIYDATPSQDTRSITTDRYRFDIPSNYSAQLQPDGSIAVVDPDTVQFLACMNRNDWGTGNYTQLTIRPSDAQVKSAMWPYDLPDFEWMMPLSPITYGLTFDGHHTALWHWESMTNGDTLTRVMNLADGGSLIVNSAYLDANGADVFGTVIVSLTAHN